MTDRAPSDRTTLAAVGVAVLAVVGCAGGPLLLAVAGSLAVGALVGITAAACVLIAACVVLYLRHRPRVKRSRAWT